MLKNVIPNMFRKSATVLYPIEKREPPPGMRGLVTIRIEDCILCGVCQKKCPSGAISVDRANGVWSIARFDCIQCHNCVDTCQKKCLEMSPERPEPVTEKVALVFRAPKAD
jgi:formate hydrogenlyase subunit 6/NADH:ubiquinone oxidoreductase subunit I